MSSPNQSGASSAVQTRYSFYEAGSADSLMEQSGSKSEDAVTVTTTGSDEENNTNGFVRDSSKGTMMMSSNGKGGENSTTVSNNVDGLFAPISSGKSIDKPGVTESEDDMQDVRETEKTSCVVIGKPPMYERGVSNVTEDTNLMTSPDTRSGDWDNRKKEIDQEHQQILYSNASNPHEKLIREALYHIRRRGQERDANTFQTPSVSAHGGKTLPSPTHPPIQGAEPATDPLVHVANATKLDNRLLSPPADVRKAASDIYRHTEICDSAITENGETNFNRLELGKPVFSIPQETVNHDKRGGSPMQKIDFSVVPSSPAPGKFQSLATDVVKNENGIQKSRQVQLEMERRTRREMEIEKGIEQVLLAILQKALSGDDGITMERFLADMFATQSQLPEIGSYGIMRPMRIDSVDEEVDKNVKGDTENQITPPSAVEELLEENSQVDDTEIDELSSAFNPITLGSKEVEAGKGQVEEPMPAQSELVDDTDTIRKSIRPLSSSSIDSSPEVENVERVESKMPIDDDEEATESDDEICDEMVLGPLSKKMGGTTGVVLQGDDNDDDEESLSDHECEEEILQDPASPSIISSVTSAARQTSKIMAKLSFGSGRSVDANEVALPLNREKDFDESFVKDLFSHMLIRHPSQKYFKSTNKKEELAGWISDQLEGTTNTSNPNYCWDDEDIDEPGYLMHTFSRASLQEIENDYESILDRLKSDYATGIKKPVTKRRAKGADFEHDLNEVEKFLDKKGKWKKKQSLSKKRKGQKNQAVSKKSNSTVNPANSSLATNPLFPGAKAAGTGEVGDLEIYHLPIIYKAHQTGFEPTKDLVLQSDTVFAGQYYVQSELGSAAFSTAYRCVDLNSGKKAEDDEIYYDEVCLKVIKNTKDFFDQSLDEIKILELLRQTNECSENNILEMKAFFYHKEHLIIVTELLRQNLFEFGKYITEHDEPVYFTRSRICYIARQCLVALSFVHKLGLVHSDIKPENILLASYSRARVKVIDFGSSCYLTDRQSSYIQSRSYRAPEVVLGLPYDGKIDVWSLGCVIAEMYTGQVTFQNDSVVTMLSRIEAICGAFPRYMVEEGHQSGQFFTPTGLLYEKVESDDESGMRMDTSASFADEDSAAAENSFFNIFQPKTTTMAERLGFDADLQKRKRKTWEEEDSILFVDFVTKLLTVDPEKRPTADEALEHPWILAGFNLSEDDLKYPPE